MTAEFRAWFLSASRGNGLLDSRLFYEDGVWRVYALQCGSGNGGPSFRVFDTTITLTEREIGQLAETTASAPKYNMVRESFTLFDTGDYRAVYATDPSLNISDPVRITVFFSYCGPESEKEYENGLQRYLAGIYNLSVVFS